MKGARQAAWGGMFAFGVAVALLGAALPLLTVRAGFDLAQAGLLFLVLNAAIVVCALALGAWIDRYGVKPALVAGPLLVALALWLVAGARGFAQLLVAAGTLGVGGGLLNIGTNTLTALLYPDPRRKNAELNRLGIFFGAGALLVPLGLAAWLSRWGLEAVLWVAAAACGGLGLYPAALRFERPAQAAPSRRSSTGLFRDRWLAVAALLLFLQSGNEMILSGYSTVHLARLGSVQEAAWATSGMWLALIAGRLLLTMLARHVGGGALVVASAMVTLPACLGLLLAPTLLSGAAALALVGAGMAGLFPTVMGLAGARFAARPGTTFGAMLAVARIGAMLLPWLAGVLAARFSTTAAIGLAAVSAGGIVVLSLTLARLARVEVRLSDPAV